MRGTIAVAIALFVGFVAGRASTIPATASPSVDEVATRGITLGKTEREAICERYCTAAIPGTPRHITVEVGRGGGTAAPEGFE